MSQTVQLVANGDLRPDANRTCWPAQQELENDLLAALAALDCQVERAHPVDPQRGHGFIDSQAHGRAVFADVDPDRPLIVAFAAWQYSQHILPGLIRHRGPILTLGNWSGTWPGLVGMLNMNGSLSKAGVRYSTLWGEDFGAASFRRALASWLADGQIEHDLSHVHPLDTFALPDDDEALGARVAEQLRARPAIMGVFDEGCMGMYNAIVPDELLFPLGVSKERLSQSALYYETTQTDADEARACLDWLQARGMHFDFGSDEASELTERQVIEQLKTYIAAVRIADDFGCDCIGIQYQQGLKDLLPASDLAEALCNNRERPPVRSRDGARELYAGEPLPHFNEVDECAGLDALIGKRVWDALGFSPETTLHDLRWGERYGDDYVWVFEISGGAPPAHFTDGFASAYSRRQPPMYFRLGGGTCAGVCKPGEIVWSRIFVADGRLKADIGRGAVRALPEAETQRRLQATTPQWPIMHAVLHGVSRDQMMARHQANHIQVAYAPDAAGAERALAVKAAAFRALGMAVTVCGDRHGLTSREAMAGAARV